MSDKATLLDDGQGKPSFRRVSSTESVEIDIGDIKESTPVPLVQTRPASLKSHAVLVLLYFCQGIPIGLVFCTIPFILKGLDSSSNKSYSELGIFSAASYPYSLKFLWSPIVDSVYLPQVGRRKSWIIPLHAIASGMLFWIGRVLPAMLTPEAIHESVWKLTWLFGGLILVCGTLEIVVDGWALSLLTEKDRKYQSSLCQTIGLNSGYFTSFTLLLSLSSSVLSLSRYIQLFASIYFCSILVVFRMKPERKEIAPQPGELLLGYKRMLKIVSLSNVRILAIILLVGKVGFVANDTLTPLKLLDRGFPKENLSITFFIDFILQTVLGWLFFGSSWTSGQEHPLRPWQLAALIKTIMATSGMWLVSAFPKDGQISNFYFLLVMTHTIVSSFCSTIMLLSMNSFFSTVSDPAVGGSYLSLLNTFSNLGTAIPRLLALAYVDKFTRRTCSLDLQMASNITGPFDDTCSTDEAVKTCIRLGGQCNIISDGYYLINSISIILGLFLMHYVVKRLVWKIEALPVASWRIQT